MGAGKQQFMEERQNENFFTRLDEGEEYAIVSMKMEEFHFLRSGAEDGHHYALHGIKQKNSKYKEDKTLCELYQEQKSVKSKILEREQIIN